MRTTIRRAVPGLFALALAAGCGSGDPPAHPVDGKLVYKDGGPVDRAAVTLTAEVDGKTYRAQGVTGADGGFRLTTFAPGDGAVAGEHAVAVSPVPGGEGPAARPTVPEQYADPDRTKLKCTVPPGGPVRIEIDRPGRR